MASTSYSILILKTTSEKHCFSLKPERNHFIGSLLSRRSRIVRSGSSSIAHSVEIINDEEIEKIKRLQNGSDVRGVALEGKKGRTVDLTPPAVEAISESFAEWLLEKLKNEEGGRDGGEEAVKVSLGRDPRISGAVLSEVVFAGLSRGGCVVFDMGLATTPACFMSTILSSFDLDGTIMLVLGAYTVKIIIEMMRMRLSGATEGIGSLIDDLEEPVESVELRMDVVAEPRYAKAKAVETIETFRRYVEDERLEGWELDSCGDCWIGEGCLVDLNDNPTSIDAHIYRVKVMDEKHGEYGWIHFRQSVHNPNIAVNMQSSLLGGCHSMAKVLKDKFLLRSGLDKIL